MLFDAQNFTWPFACIAIFAGQWSARSRRASRALSRGASQPATAAILSNRLSFNKREALLISEPLIARNSRKPSPAEYCNKANASIPIPLRGNRRRGFIGSAFGRAAAVRRSVVVIDDFDRQVEKLRAVTGPCGLR